MVFTVLVFHHEETLLQQRRDRLLQGGQEEGRPQEPHDRCVCVRTIFTLTSPDPTEFLLPLCHTYIKLSLSLRFRHQHVDGHDEGKPDQRPAHDCDRWVDQLGFLWIRHK